MKTTTTVSCMHMLAPALFAAAAFGADWVGHGGRNGQRIHADATPPTSGFKVLWDTPMKTWGHSSPVYINLERAVISDQLSVIS